MVANGPFGIQRRVVVNGVLKIQNVYENTKPHRQRPTPNFNTIPYFLLSDLFRFTFFRGDTGVSDMVGKFLSANIRICPYAYRC